MSSLPPTPDAHVWLRQRLGQMLRRTPEKVPEDRPLAGLGLTSLMAATLAAEFGELSGRQLSPVAVWEFPTLAKLAAHWDRAHGADEQHVRSRIASARASADEPIAAVGAACRLPGAADLRAYWDVLSHGRWTVGELTDARWPIDRYHAEIAGVSGRCHTRHAGLIDGIDLFDPLFFGISPREAEHMDPQQRLYLELTWDALVNSGIVPKTLEGQRIGVFAGVTWNDYGALIERDPGAIGQHTATGKATNMVANRVSHVFGFEGPSITVDTACSSSLVAIHMAIQSILSEDCRLAVAGGVNLLIDPTTMVGLSKFGGLSEDGRCKAFDARADGFVRGEGGGAIVLERLSDALAAGHRVYAIIRGSAINNDGRSNGLTAPNPSAQRDVLRRACVRANVDPEDIGYVEAHGTGTALGDPIEASALGAVFGSERKVSTELRIGSAKTNLGHLEAAAGVAGFLKSMLCLHQQAFVPSLHFDTPNPHIAFDDLRLRVQTETKRWTDSETRLAGVSAFGWGGTNAHVLLEAAPDQVFRRGWHWREKEGSAAKAANCQAGAGASFREQSTTNEKQAPRPQADPEKPCTRANPQTTGIALVCAPQGGQWRGMARTMLSNRVFRATLGEVAGAYSRFADWSLLDALTDSHTDWAFLSAETIQPMIVAIQIAQAAVWRSHGVFVDAIVGHSLGEITAAHLCGALSLNDTARLVIAYSRLQSTTDGQGSMAIVARSPTDLADRVDGVRICLAGYNSPESSVVSGLRQDLEPLVEALASEGTFARFVDVNVGAHSPLVDPILTQLQADLAEIVPQPAHTTMVSSLTGRPIAATELGASYWPKNLRKPVLFRHAIEELLASGIETFIELGPHPVLRPAVEEIAVHRGHSTLCLATARREDEDQNFLKSMNRLAVNGAPGPSRASIQSESPPNDGFDGGNPRATIPYPIVISGHTRARCSAACNESPAQKLSRRIIGSM